MPNPFSRTLRCQQPERAQHCPEMKKCVLKMHHYFPLINNCIGFYNEKYYFLCIVHLSKLISDPSGESQSARC